MTAGAPQLWFQTTILYQPYQYERAGEGVGWVVWWSYWALSFPASFQLSFKKVGDRVYIALQKKRIAWNWKRANERVVLKNNLVPFRTYSSFWYGSSYFRVTLWRAESDQEYLDNTKCKCISSKRDNDREHKIKECDSFVTIQDVVYCSASQSRRAYFLLMIKMSYLWLSVHRKPLTTGE